MIKKLLFCILLITCLAGTATAINISGNSSVNMNSAGATYNLTGDMYVSGGALTIGASNITLDGKNYETGEIYTITYGMSATGTGIVGSGKSNVVIKNVNIVDYPDENVNGGNGVSLTSCQNVELSDVNISTPSGAGVSLSLTNYSTIANCVINSNTNHGYLASGSYYNTVKNSVISSNSGNGAYLYSSAAYNNFNDSVFTSISGKGVLFSNVCNYMKNSTASSSSDVGIDLWNSDLSILDNCTGVSVSNTGISLDHSTASAVVINSDGVSSSGKGILVALTSTSNSFTNDIGESNNSTGVYISGTSVSNQFSDCTGRSNYSYGLDFDSTSVSNTFTRQSVFSPVASTGHSSKHVLVLGDSISYGSGVPYPYGYYANQTLNEKSPGFYVSRRGVPGEQSSAGASRAIVELGIYDPHIVVIEYGTNDIAASRSQDLIITDILNIANASINTGSKPYILLTPARNDGNNQKIIYLDQNLSAQADALGIDVINGYDQIDTSPGDGIYDSFNSSNYVDTVHPNTTGHTLLGLAAAQKILEFVDFSSSGVSGTVPCPISFYNGAFNGSEYFWDFENDGVIDSTKQNPVHTYGKPGTYSVNLTVSNEYGNFSTVKTDYITVTAQTPPTTIDQIFNILKHFFFGLSTPEAAS